MFRCPVLALLLLFLSNVAALVVTPSILSPSPARAIAAAENVGVQSAVQRGINMACRKNLKKDKRLRNRVNAFRFKKGGSSMNRFNNFADRKAASDNERADAEFMALVFSAAPSEATEDATAEASP